MFYLKQQLLALLQAAVADLQAKGVLPADLPPVSELERTGTPQFGEYSSNYAMKRAKAFRKPPPAIAAALAEALATQTGLLKDVQVAGPGFINLYLKPAALLRIIDQLRAAGEQYGQASWGQGRKLLLEFVSANPTGPLNIVSARAAAVGDSLARILKSQGVSVDTEYYINDAGNQALLLGESLVARYHQLQGKDAAVPEEGYQGEYIIDLAKEIAAENPEALQEALQSPAPRSKLLELFKAKGIEKIVYWHKSALQDFGVEFTNWFHEKDLVAPPRGSRILPFDKILEQLQAKGYIYEKDGAKWFRSTDFGDDKDRVVEKSDGTITYLATDIAYHVYKYARGFTELVDLWGPDHHGYIARLKAAVQALGHPPDAFQVKIVQQVNLLENGQPVAMSKRAGHFIQMSDLVEEVGKDVARFFFLMRSTDAHLDFDLDLARKHTEENPVFYVQYAHARISSILRKAIVDGWVLPAPGEPVAEENTSPEPEELLLAGDLAAYPEILEHCARTQEPHGLAFALKDLATRFHRFYTVCRVLDTTDRLRSQARMALADATRIVLHNGLTLLGIEAPESM